MSNKYSAVSLFSGAGGLDLGFHLTGRVATQACYELDPVFAETLRSNHLQLSDHERPDHPRPFIHQEDLSDPGVLEQLVRQYASADIVFGGPPCQSFSIMGKKGGTEDPRGRLIYSFLNVVQGIKPQAFLFENVPNFTRIGGGEIASRLIQAFKEEGYSTWSGTLCAADFGAYTFRKRFIILGFKGSLNVEAPKLTHSKRAVKGGNTNIQPWLPCADVFRQISEWVSAGKTLSNNDEIKHTPQVVERFKSLKFGETDNVRKRNRLDPARPAHSVYVGGTTGKLQARAHIHPYLPRELTPRECATIQGFPLDWRFSGRADAALLQAANAVPVQFGKALADHLIGVMGNRSSKPTAPTR